MKGRGFLLAAVANVLGGLSYLAQKLALAGLPAATVTVLRNAIALVLMMAWIRWRGTPRTAWSRRDLGLLLLLGTIGYGFPMWLGIEGVERSTSANGSILVLIEPMMVLVFAAAFLRERVTRRQLAGVLVGLVGALAIVLEGAAPGDLLAGEHLEGNLLLVLHGVGWGTFTPLVKPLAARHDPWIVIAGATAISLVVVGPFALAERGAWTAGPDLLPALGWVVALALGVSIASAVLWAQATRFVPAASIAPFVFLQPLTGIVAGAAVLGERLTPVSLAGAAVIAIGVAVVLRGSGGGTAPDAGTRPRLPPSG
jgi:drug/metabolite transporter (DMT)-like permease